MKRNAWLIGWPSFLTAGVLEMLIFSATHPDDLTGFGGLLAELSATGVYTLAFFSFWLIAALGSALTLLLAAPSGSD